MKKIAVFGYSIMSLEVMKRLNPDQHQIVFAGKNEQEVALVTAEGFYGKAINFQDDDDLKAIGIGVDVDILFCFYPMDSDNVFLTISARALAKKLTIIAIIDEPDSAEKLLAAGADKIIDPYEICGRKTYDMLFNPDITNILDNTVFGQHELNLAQVKIISKSCLENSMLSDLKRNQPHNVIIIGVVNRDSSEKLLFALEGQDHHLNVGDFLVVLGAAEEIRLFKDKVESPNPFF